VAPLDIFERVSKVADIFLNFVQRAEVVNLCFALYSTGWGGFTIKIEILFTNGLRTNTTFYLALKKDGWPRKSLDHNAASNQTVRVYDQLFHPKYRWRTIDTLVKGAGLQKSEVQMLLLPTAQDHLPSL